MLIICTIVQAGRLKKANFFNPILGQNIRILARNLYRGRYIVQGTQSSLI
jgi:hypothetical protein